MAQLKVLLGHDMWPYTVAEAKKLSLPIAKVSKTFPSWKQKVAALAKQNTL